MLILLSAVAVTAAEPYTWTRDHMHVGVRWQPFGRPANNAYDGQRPVIAKDSSYAQFWVAWAAAESDPKHVDYANNMSGYLRDIEVAVDRCVELGLKVEFVFWHVPGWATVSGNAGPWRARDGEFAKFATRIATHFKGRVGAYQLAHESNLNGFIKDGDMHYLMREVFIGGAKAIRAVYGDSPVLISTAGCSPCQTCPSLPPLKGVGGRAVHDYYDHLIANSTLMEQVDALNLNISDHFNGYGMIDGSFITSAWHNYDVARQKLDAAGYAHKGVMAAESWIVWDTAGMAVDVDGNGVIDERDAYDKCVTLMGQCLQRGLNTMNFPWSDNSSGWAMGLTKRRDYNGRVKSLRPDLVVPAKDGGPDIITRKVLLRGGDDSFEVRPRKYFTKKDHLDPSDPNHLHYYVWRWYAQIAGGSDEVIRHAIAGEVGNDITVAGPGMTGHEQYKVASWNRSRDTFTVLIYSSGANGKTWGKVAIPSRIRTGRHYNNDSSKIDFRGEGFQNGETYHVRVTTKNIDRDSGSDQNVATTETRYQTVNREMLNATIQGMKRFTKIEFIRAPLPKPPEVWEGFDPDAGDFKEEIVSDRVEGGVRHRESYISAYVLGEEVRVYCKYQVKEGAKNVPGLMDVHGWMGSPAPDKSYVNDGWAVMSHDYCGKSGNRPHYTKYPEALRYGNMDAKVGYRVKSKLPDGSFISDPKQTDDYLWYAIQRRVLSYLLTQPEVDASRIGAKGYSYGGTIMWNLGMDPRVKAVVAYFGIGWLEYYRSRGVWLYGGGRPAKTEGEHFYLSAIAPQAHAPYIKAASLWLNGTNDHHGGHERGEQTFANFADGVPWDFAHQARAHHNTEKIAQNAKQWLEKHVLGKDFHWPARPTAALGLDADGVPEFRVEPGLASQVKELQIYYALKSPVSYARSWRDTEVVREGNSWRASLPVLNVNDYLFAFANITYNSGTVISTNFTAAIPAKLGKAVATDKPSSLISEGTGVWTDVAPVEGVGGVKGFRALNNHRGTMNESFNDPKWKAPKGAQLSFDFYCTQPQTIRISVSDHNLADVEITASNDWQTITLPATRFINRHSKQPMADWSRTTRVKLQPATGSDITKVVFAKFRWHTP